jgi:hypothetical protein
MSLSLEYLLLDGVRPQAAVQDNKTMLDLATDASCSRQCKVVYRASANLVGRYRPAGLESRLPAKKTESLRPSPSQALYFVGRRTR